MTTFVFICILKQLLEKEGNYFENGKCFKPVVLNCGSRPL